ncbi:MAG: hypothetical protein AAFY88_12715, partial [Acidobacteriota bacterium]
MRRYFKKPPRRRSQRYTAPLALALASALTASSVGAQGASTPEAQTDAAPATRSPSEAIAVDLPGDRAWTEIPFRLDSSKIILPLRINETETVDAVLDTGASSAILLDPDV